MTEQTSMLPTPKVRELADGDHVLYLLVRECEVRERKDGTPYLALVLSDKTGRLDARVWPDAKALDGATAETLAATLPPGTPVKVGGRFKNDPKYGPELAADKIRPAEADEYDADALYDGPDRSVAELEQSFRALIGTVQDQHLHRVLMVVFGDGTATWEAFREAPAARGVHHAYRHGLLEHTLLVAEAVWAAATTFDGVNQDVAVTGALLHDIGKLDAYTPGPLDIDLTTDGRLVSEIPLGYYRVRRLIEDLPDFPPDLARAVLHIIISHHGRLEHGSPATPVTREAMLVHYCDQIGAKLGTLDRLQRAMADGAEWSEKDRGMDWGKAWFGPRVPDETTEGDA